MTDWQPDHQDGSARPAQLLRQGTGGGRHSSPDAPPPSVPSPPRASARQRLLAGLGGVVNTSRDAHESLEVHARLSAAVPSGRRTVVLGLRPSTGCTTVAALISLAIASRRCEPLLVVDAARTGPNPPIDARLACRPVRSLQSIAADPPDVHRREDLAEFLTPVGRDLWLLPGHHEDPPLGLSGPDAATYAAAVGGLSRYFDIVVTDLGADTEQSVEVLTSAHALCVVCSASDAGIHYADALIRGLRDGGGRSWAGRTVILANAREDDAKITFTARAAARRTRRAQIPVVVLPYDRALAGALPQAVRGLTPQTHRAALRVGATLLDTAVPTAPELAR